MFSFSECTSTVTVPGGHACIHRLDAGTGPPCLSRGGLQTGPPTRAQRQRQAAGPHWQVPPKQRRDQRGQPQGPLPAVAQAPPQWGSVARASLRRRAAWPWVPQRLPQAETRAQAWQPRRASCRGRRGPASCRSCRRGRRVRAPGGLRIAARGRAGLRRGPQGGRHQRAAAAQTRSRRQTRPAETGVGRVLGLLERIVLPCNRPTCLHEGRRGRVSSRGAPGSGGSHGWRGRVGAGGGRVRRGRRLGRVLEQQRAACQCSDGGAGKGRVVTGGAGRRRCGGGGAPAAVSVRK